MTLRRVEGKLAKSRGVLHPPRETGGPYEVYVVSNDGFYVAGGVQQYTNKRAAIRNANDWLESRRNVRAYVVTL